MNKSALLLVVEDDPVLGPVTLDMLHLMGHESMLAASSGEAFTILTRPHHIDLVMLDLQLGSERGEALIEAIRDMATPPPVIIFSALPIADLRRAANEIGALAILQKPCSVNQMTKVIDTALA